MVTTELGTDKKCAPANPRFWMDASPLAPRDDRSQASAEGAGFQDMEFVGPYDRESGSGPEILILGLFSERAKNAVVRIIVAASRTTTSCTRLIERLVEACG